MRVKAVVGTLLATILIQPALAQTMTVSYLASALRAVGSALFGLALLWGAAKIMASGGDQRMLEEGKNVIKNAIIGYILIILASFIAVGSLNLDPLVIIP